MSNGSSRIEHNDRLRHIRGRFHGARDSEHHISIRTPKTSITKDIGRQKKLKFLTLDNDSPTIFRLEEREKTTTYAETDPKTSEYAFVKKFKKDAALRFRSHSLHKDAYLSKKPESSNYARERTDDVRVGSKGFNSSRIIEDVSTAKADSFLSPSVGALNKSDQYSISSMWKNSQGCHDAFKHEGIFSHEGNQYVHGEIFSRKRQKLRQCVADALFPDIEELCSEGHDIVSLLLSRLFPTSTEEPKYEDPNPGKVVSATRYDLLDSRESDVQFKEHQQIPKRKLLELESSSCFSDHLLSPVFLRSDERITPHADFPTYHSRKFQPMYTIIEPECEFGGTPSFSAKSDVTLGFPFSEKEHETFTLNHFKELGKTGRQPSPLLLEKDFDCTTDEINLPVTYKYAEPDTAPSLSTSRKEQTLTEIFGEYHFSPSFLLLEKRQDFNSMLDTGLLRYQEFRFGKCVYEDKTKMDMNSDHTALSLSHNKDYFNLSEECKNDTSCVQDSICLSPCQHWIRTVSNNFHYQHPDTEAWLLSSLDFISGQRCLSLTSSHSDYQSSNAGSLQLPLRESLSSLFHDNDNFEAEMDGGNHGEVLNHFKKDVLEICNSSFLHILMQRDNGCPLPLDGNGYYQ